jgi:hypothetical protein
MRLKRASGLPQVRGGITVFTVGHHPDFRGPAIRFRYTVAVEHRGQEVCGKALAAATDDIGQAGRDGRREIQTFAEVFQVRVAFCQLPGLCSR